MGFILDAADAAERFKTRAQLEQNRAQRRIDLLRDQGKRQIVIAEQKVAATHTILTNHVTRVFNRVTQRVDRFKHTVRSAEDDVARPVKDFFRRL